MEEEEGGAGNDLAGRSRRPSAPSVSLSSPSLASLSSSFSARILHSTHILYRVAPCLSSPSFFPPSSSPFFFVLLFVIRLARFGSLFLLLLPSSTIQTGFGFTSVRPTLDSSLRSTRLARRPCFSSCFFAALLFTIFDALTPCLLSTSACRSLSSSLLLLHWWTDNRQDRDASILLVKKDARLVSTARSNPRPESDLTSLLTSLLARFSKTSHTLSLLTNARPSVSGR